MTSYIENGEKVLSVRVYRFIPDTEVAKRYNVDVKEIRRLYMDNQERFPERYCIMRSKDPADEIGKQDNLSETQEKTDPEALYFTDKGANMMATLLKSKEALQRVVTLVESYEKATEWATLLLEDLKGGREKDGDKENEDKNYMRITVLFQELCEVLFPDKRIDDFLGTKEDEAKTEVFGES